MLEKDACMQEGEKSMIASRQPQACSHLIYEF